ncbi:uncharacterized protein LOC129583107 [Paramacrobiotus metropolitanus]|uniref:uncharacterized protein LOC129583107 n=1 Tax=Paramacrobiotus metropolitanus TaxID=2943436 RepID=UPI00244608F4|nr:uncharacterized protein LOC129583107 [Paramacrobiotus metropolitanus]
MDDLETDPLFPTVPPDLRRRVPDKEDITNRGAPVPASPSTDVWNARISARFGRFVAFTWIVLRLLGLVRSCSTGHLGWKALLFIMNVVWCIVIIVLLIILWIVDTLPQMEMCFLKIKYLKIMAMLLKFGSLEIFFIFVSRNLWDMPYYLKNVFDHYLHSRSLPKAPGKRLMFAWRIRLAGAAVLSAIAAINFLLHKFQLGLLTDIPGVHARELQLWAQAYNDNPLSVSGKRATAYYWALYAGVMADVQFAMVRGIVILYCKLAACTFYNWRRVIHHPGREGFRDTLSAWQRHEKEYGKHFYDVWEMCRSDRLGMLLRLVFFHDYMACALVVRDLCLHKDGFAQPGVNLTAMLSQVLMTRVLANAVAAVSEEGNPLTEILDDTLSKVDGR